MPLEELKIVPKVFGREIIIVNNDLYCGKFLQFDAGAKGSLHRHHKKTESFYCVKGEAKLLLEGVVHRLTHKDPPVTIICGQQHQVTAITACKILEVSTPHDDADVERFTQSEMGIAACLKRFLSKGFRYFINKI